MASTITKYFFHLSTAASSLRNRAKPEVDTMHVNVSQAPSEKKLQV